jgi:hypothetical protein
MQAIRIPYPLPTTLPTYRELQSLRHWGRIIDFPDRHFSYVLSNCDQRDVERYLLEVLKAVDLQTRGEEPARLEIRFTG